MMLKFAFALAFLMCGITGNDNGCKNPKSMKNFDIKKYIGVWYEIQKNPVLFERNLTCGFVNYTLAGHYVDFNFQAVKSDGTIRDLKGHSFVINQNEPGKYFTTFQNAPYQFNYWILDTDYTSYSVAYACDPSNKSSHHKYLWISSRTKTLPSATLDNIFHFLDDIKMDRTKLHSVNQNCTKTEKHLK